MQEQGFGKTLNKPCQATCLILTDYRQPQKKVKVEQQKYQKVIRYGPYRIGREYLAEIEARAKRVDQASKGIKSEPMQLVIPWFKGEI